jgi:mRNA-degrading endonuclease RelE of RelBE toxin-antitoxin system
MYTESASISFTLEYKRNPRSLAQKYRSIRSDLQPLIDLLQSGDLPGDQITGIKLPIFKVRLQNSDIQKGKRSGYRCIYYLKTDSDIILVTIYSKTEQVDVSAARLRSILLEMGLS